MRGRPTRGLQPASQALVLQSPPLRLPSPPLPPHPSSSFPKATTAHRSRGVIHKEAMETESREGDGGHKDGSTMGVNMTTFIKECKRRTVTMAAASSTDRIINPDPTAKTVNSAFYGIYPRLLPILRKDDERQFLRFFQKAYLAMTWDFITPQTLLHMILEDSVRCANVVLEGQAPELNGHRAYSNCATQYGFFPLHQAAEIFSVDMIKVLLQHGASANVRTCGDRVVDGLLPLHVAVENTCMHKYLDDNLFAHELYPNYWKADTKDIYKLIHLLCLPEMKIFLDTTRLLAGHTDDLLGEICNYIRHGKLVQTAVLLMAAQEHIQGGCSGQKKGNNKPDGFSYIIRYIAEHISAIKLEVGRDEKEQQLLKMNYISSILWLVEAISVAGESLDAYIQGHSKVPNEEVLECVSSILKFHGFCPTGEDISIGSLNLSPYKLPLPEGVIPSEHGYALASKIATDAGRRKVMGKKPALPRGFDLKYRRKSFFPFWRSALSIGFPVKIYPSYALEDKHQSDLKTICENDVNKEPSPTPDHNSSLLNSVLQLKSTYQLKRTFSTATFPRNYQSSRIFGTAALPSSYQAERLFGNAALALLKMVKRA